MALNEGICDPEPRVTNIKGTHLKSLIMTREQTLKVQAEAGLG